MEPNRSFYGKKVCVIIPCKNRIDMLNTVLPRWLEQIYENYQLVLVDYSSDVNIYPHVMRYANRYHISCDYNVEFSEAKISVLRVENQQYFNMSHALNYAIKRTKSEVISIAGAESLPAAFYLETAMMAIDHNIFSRCVHGRLTYPRKMIEDINGYPELIEYWGGEDDMAVLQFIANNNYVCDLNYMIVQNIAHYAGWNQQYYATYSRYRNRRKGLEGVEEYLELCCSYINMRRSEKYMQDFRVNNYGLKYGGDNPILIKPEHDVDIDYIKTTLETSGDEIVKDAKRLYEIFTTSTRKMYYGKRCAVIIPVMDRLDDLRATLPQWIDQLYVNKQIIVLDYSSKEPVAPFVEDICKSYNITYSIGEYDPHAEVIVLRIEGMQFFNISHAYNYAISQVDAEVLMTACVDSCPRDYYMDLCINLVDEFHLVQCYWGLHCISYENWKKLNGHQEFIVGWGSEDVDFQLRAKLMGLYVKILPKHLVFHIPHDNAVRGINRKIKNTARSSIINDALLSSYIAHYGYVGNYGYALGGDQPIDSIHDLSVDKLKRLHVCSTDDFNPQKPPEGILYNDEYKVFYKICDDDFDWSNICKFHKRYVFLIPDGADIGKYLYSASRIAPERSSGLDSSGEF